MAKTIQTKRCSICKEIKPFSEFYKNRTRKDGYKAYCKTCSKKYQQSEKGKVDQKHYGQSKKGKKTIQRAISNYEKRNLEKIKAKQAVHNAVRASRLPQPDTLKCRYCPTQAEQYHHPSYAPENWLKVEPVCRKCHKKAS